MSFLLFDFLLSISLIISPLSFDDYGMNIANWIMVHDDRCVEKFDMLKCATDDETFHQILNHVETIVIHHYMMQQVKQSQNDKIFYPTQSKREQSK